MLNQVNIVGRLVKEVELKELESGKKVANITVAVPRSFKNEYGEYETDFINCVLWNGVAENTAEYCHKADIVGVRGRLQTRTIEKEDGTKEYIQEVIAERVSFLSNKKRDD